MKNEKELVKAKEEVIDLKVKNKSGEDLGKIEELMLEKVSGQVAYAVLKSGSFLGMGGKLYAIPWKTFHYDPDEECFMLDIDFDRLKEAPSFDKDQWPDMEDRAWRDTISTYYENKPKPDNE